MTKKITLNLTIRAENALDKLKSRTEDGATTCINRALVIYEFLTRLESEGLEVEVFNQSGERQRIRFL